jgi:hypothetical protein
MKPLICLFLFALFYHQKVVDCSCKGLRWCNGHGKCVNNLCHCQEGWGSSIDIAAFKAADCSLRTCPSAVSWGTVPQVQDITPEEAVKVHSLAECSNQGQCDRTSGICVCNVGFTGKACQRSVCPNKCSGHGRYSLLTLGNLCFPF